MHRESLNAPFFSYVEIFRGSAFMICLCSSLLRLELHKTLSLSAHGSHIIIKPDPWIVFFHQHTMLKFKRALLSVLQDFQTFDDHDLPFFSSSASWTAQHRFNFYTKNSHEHDKISRSHRFIPFHENFSNTALCCWKQSLSESADQKKLYYKKESGKALGPAPSISMHGILNSLLSPYYCTEWFQNMAQNLKIAGFYMDVTGLSFSLRPANASQCSVWYWFTLSLLPCTVLKTFFG